MSLSQSVSNSVPFTSAYAVHVVLIDVECILPSAGRFNDYNTDEESAYANGVVGSPYDNLQIVFAMQKICSFPGFGRPTKNRDFDFSECYSVGGGKHANCVEEYIEYIHELNGELAAWRIFYVARDPEFSFDRALTELFISETKKRLRRRPGPPTTAPKARKNFSLPRTQRMWVREYISPYLGNRFDDNPSTVDELNSATALDIMSKDNPASCHKCLTLEWSNTILLQRYGDRIDPEYRNVSAYYGNEVAPKAPVVENDFLIAEPQVMADVATTRITFPFGAHPLQHSMRDPKIFFAMDIRRPPDTIENAAMLKFPNYAILGDDEQAVCRRIIGNENNKRMRQETTRLGSEDVVVLENPALAPVRDRFKYDLSKCATAEEQHAYRSSQGAATACASVIFNDPLNPCGRIVMNWYHEQVKANSLWSTVQPFRHGLDSKLSDFGNLMAERMIASETDGGGIAVLHKEVLMMQLARCISGDIEDPKLRLHFVFYGPPGSGKSFILYMNECTSIPGTIRWISNQSAKANTTNEVLNGFQLQIDEAPAILTGGGEDGTGDANWKSLLSNGIIYTETAFINTETRTRESIMTESLRKCQVSIATNQKLSAFAEAFVSRWYSCSVPEQHRDDVDPVLFSLKMQSNPAMQSAYDSYCNYWHIVQFISFYLWCRYHSKLFLMVENEMVLKLASLAFQYLKKEHGILIEKRDQQKIMMMTQALTIFHAIHKVFLSGDVIEEGTPFDDKMLARLIPYLHSTREHFYFAFSLLDQIVADPSTLIVLDALRDINRGYKTDEDIYSPPTKERSHIDFNYYSITLTSNVLGNDVIPIISRQVVRHISNTTNYKLSADSVSDIITKLTTMTTRCAQYDEHGNATTREEVIPVVRFRSFGFKAGIEISRCYIENAVATRANLVEEAIKATFDRHMPGDHILLGQSMRYGYKDDPNSNIPFLFNVIKVNPDRSVYPLLVLPKDGHVSTIGSFLSTGVHSDVIESIFEVCDYSIDKRSADEWYARCGAYPDPPSKRERLYFGSYPSSIAEAYVKEHKKPIVLSSNGPKPAMAACKPPASYVPVVHYDEMDYFDELSSLYT